MTDTLINIKEEMSLAIIAGTSYPIVEISTEKAIIAAATRKTAQNISNRTGGDVVDTPLKEFPYEIHISFEIFDRIIEFDKWSDLADKLIDN